MKLENFKRLLEESIEHLQSIKIFDDFETYTNKKNYSLKIKERINTNSKSVYCETLEGKIEFQKYIIKSIEYMNQMVENSKNNMEL